MKQLSDYTDIELKAIAFDQIQLRETAIANLNAIANELRARQATKSKDAEGSKSQDPE